MLSLVFALGVVAVVVMIPLGIAVIVVVVGLCEVFPVVAPLSVIVTTHHEACGEGDSRYRVGSGVTTVHQANPPR
jgi:hypothetical protein